MMWLRNGVIFALLVFYTVSDVRCGEVWWPAAAAVGMAGWLLNLVQAGWQGNMITLTGSLPGMFLTGMAFLTKEEIGYGDCLTIIACGILQGMAAEMEALLIALLLTALWSVRLLLRKKGGRKTRLLFLPFLLAGQLLMLVLGIFFS